MASACTLCTILSGPDGARMHIQTLTNEHHKWNLGQSVLAILPSRMCCGHWGPRMTWFSRGWALVSCQRGNPAIRPSPQWAWYLGLMLGWCQRAGARVRNLVKDMLSVRAREAGGLNSWSTDPGNHPLCRPWFYSVRVYEEKVATAQGLRCSVSVLRMDIHTVCFECISSGFISNNLGGMCVWLSWWSAC